MAIKLLVLVEDVEDPVNFAFRLNGLTTVYPLFLLPMVGSVEQLL